MSNAKRHISDIIGIEKGHANFDFVDINIYKDQELFIDPSLIQTSESKWANESKNIIQSYFDKLCCVYQNNLSKDKDTLLSYAREVNYTKLGYSKVRSGSGSTLEGLKELFVNIDSHIKKIKTFKNPIDLYLTIRGFGEDKFSDLLTNLLHKQLHDFTISELEKYSVKPNSEYSFFAWNKSTEDWEKHTEKCYRSPAGVILLVPKSIVRKQYLFGHHEFIERIIKENIQKERATTDKNGKTRFPPKNSIYLFEKNDKNAEYNYFINSITNDSSLLSDLHSRIHELFSDKRLSDENLDRIIYQV